MRARLVPAAVAVIACSTLGVFAQAPAVSRLALVGGMLLDGYDAPPIHHAAVLVEGDRIVRVGPASEVPIPAGARVIDTRGRTMMPGMIELHAHLVLLGHGDEYDEIAPTRTGGFFDHGTSGTIAIPPRIVVRGSHVRGMAQTVTHELTHRFVEAAQQAGLPLTKDLNGSQKEGVGYSQMSRNGRFRGSTARTFLAQAKGRPNLRIETNAVATRLLFDGKRCTGVAFYQGVAERSADAAVRVLARSGRPQADCDLVRRMIMATRHGAQPTKPALALTVDCDLWILGAAADRYAEFELQVRAEYWWVPTAMYRKQRSAILASFVNRPSVYATHEFRERYERQARNNLAWGLEQLNFGRATFRWTARF